MRRLPVLVISLCLIIILVISVLVSACAKPAAPTTTAPAPVAKVLKWRCPMQYGPSVFYEEEVKAMNNIKIMSGGRLEITPYPLDSLMPIAQVFDAISRGTIEMTQSASSYWQGFIPEGGIESGKYGLPFRIDDWYTLMFERGYADVLREAYGEKNVYYLLPMPGGTTALWAKKKVTTMADLKGLKVRTSPGDVQTIVSSLGASTVSIPLTELYTALQLGTIDAVLTSHNWFFNLKHYELAKFFTIEPNFGHDTVHWLVNKDAWTGLSPDLKQIVWNGIMPLFYTYYHTDGYDTDTNKLLLAITQAKKDYGIQTFAWDPEVSNAFIAAGMKLLNEKAKINARCAKLVDIELTLARDLGYIK